MGGCSADVVKDGDMPKARIKIVKIPSLPFNCWRRCSVDQPNEDHPILISLGYEEQHWYHFSLERALASVILERYIYLFFVGMT